ncbi:FAD-dependent monooxygenase [Streptomyces sp. I05A-00742]|uniref:FAD-dependent monooxygenase n=1 Tax=Streptomyces sp. I05A-00742 TaxID=2732853 RepID=UPI00148863A4|nr:FAD-dependent monooxygenase [Streptomyces sp. I05A-00742]
MVEHVPVLIAGGGLSGLTTALFLGLHGVRPLLVEKHPGTSVVLKARGQYPHTMEALRVAGVADRITAASPGGTGDFYMVVAESLAGPVLQSIMTRGEMAMDHVSPEQWAMASQERTEEILAERAAELGARLEFSTELVSFTQDEDGVTAVLRELTTGRERTVRAGHLVGADGWRSPVREALGIGTHGRGTLGHVLRVFFTADMSAHLSGLPGVAEGHRFALFHLLGEGHGVFYTTDTPGLYGWVGPLTTEPTGATTLSDAELTELIRRSTGLPALRLTITEKGETPILLNVADRFSSGRAHLVGDAAKVIPAPGGLGGNTAVMDGFYLAWKLAAVVRGEAGPGLLDSHDAERRPVADMIADQQFANTVLRMAPELDDGTAVDTIAPVVQVFGYRCVQGAVVPEPGDDGALLEDPAAPTGRPGSRAPHVGLVRDGRPVSTISLFGRGFVLLAGAEGTAWEKAADEAAAELGVPLRYHRVGGPGAELQDPGGRWAAAYGVTAGGAVLVRPDRFVAWRSPAEGTTDDLVRALRTVLDRPAEGHPVRVAEDLIPAAKARTT